MSHFHLEIAPFCIFIFIIITSGPPAETIALEIACWLQESHLLDVMSRKAMKVGHPHAAEEIALDIGERTHTCLERNKLKHTP